MWRWVSVFGSAWIKASRDPEGAGFIAINEPVFVDAFKLRLKRETSARRARILGAPRSGSPAGEGAPESRESPPPGRRGIGLP